MKKTTLFILVILLVLLPSLALANDLPPVKSGLWEVTSQKGKKVQHCIDQESLRNLFNSSKQMMKGTCSDMKISKSGSAYHSLVTCNFMGSKINVKSIVSGNFSKRYTSKTTTRFDPPMFGQTGDTTEEVSTYLGTCPKGMVAGDMKIGEGQSINANKMMKNMPDMNTINKMVRQGLQSGNVPNQAQIQKMMQEMQKARGAN